MPKKTQSAQSQSFEEVLGSLETLVNRMETDELTLEDAIASYEQGVKLAARLNEQLDRSERALTVLRGDGAPSDIDSEESKI